MPEFSYSVKTASGELHKGTINSPSEEAAIQQLQRQNYIVLSISAEDAQPILRREIKWFEHIPARELVIFARQFSVLTSAKVALVQALKVISVQTENIHLQRRLFIVATDVEGGLALSKALEKHPSIFSEFFVQIVRSAEYSGKLQEALLYLADHLEREYTLRTKVRNALVYPAFILGVLIIVGVVMITYVLPQISSILRETGQELPVITRVIIATGDFLATWWWVVLFGLLALLGLLAQYIHTPSGRFWWDRLKLEMPLFGSLFTKLSLARFSDNLATLITAGVPITQALEITANVAQNGVFKGIIDHTTEEIKAGNTMSSVLNIHEEIPPMVTHMVYVGEQTGKLDYTLKEVARFYEREVNSLVDNMVELILPVVIVILGVVVGFFVIGIIAPIYQFAQNLS
ncbi:MAG: type II secretion system F family protein [Parcubacteria group bacterium]|nr:type II secretion system F family protein [Parcubacteria group bacterium]